MRALTGSIRVLAIAGAAFLAGGPAWAQGNCPDTCPGCPNVLVLASVRINELHFRTVEGGLAAFTELCNMSTQDQCLTGVSLVGRDASGRVYATVELPQGTFIPAEGYYVVGEMASPDLQADHVDSRVNWRDGPGQIQLCCCIDPSGSGCATTVDSVCYGPVDQNVFAVQGHPCEGWPTTCNPTAGLVSEGSSLCRCPTGSETDDNAADFREDPTPTPGEPNDDCPLPFMVINEIVYNATDYVELYGTRNYPLQHFHLAIYDASGTLQSTRTLAPLATSDQGVQSVLIPPDPTLTEGLYDDGGKVELYFTDPAGSPPTPTLADTLCYGAYDASLDPACECASKSASQIGHSLARRYDGCDSENTDRDFDSSIPSPLLSPHSPYGLNNPTTPASTGCSPTSGGDRHDCTPPPQECESRCALCPCYGHAPEIVDFWATSETFTRPDDEIATEDDLDSTIENIFFVRVKPGTACYYNDRDSATNEQVKVELDVCAVKISYEKYNPNPPPGEEPCSTLHTVDAEFVEADEETGVELWTATFDVQPFRCSPHYTLGVTNSLGCCFTGCCDTNGGCPVVCPERESGCIEFNLLRQDTGIEEDPVTADTTPPWISDPVQSLTNALPKGISFGASFFDDLFTVEYEYDFETGEKKIKIEGGSEFGSAGGMGDISEGKSPISDGDGDDDEKETYVKGEWSFGITFDAELLTSVEATGEAKVEGAIGGREFEAAIKISVTIGSPLSDDEASIVEYYKTMALQRVDIEGSASIDAYSTSIPLPPGLSKLKKWVDPIDITITPGLELGSTLEGTNTSDYPEHFFDVSLTHLLVTPSVRGTASTKFDVKIATIKAYAFAQLNLPLEYCKSPAPGADPDRGFQIYITGSVGAGGEIEFFWGDEYGPKEKEWPFATKPFVIAGAACPEEGHCDDGLDNDGDGATDCDDADCAGDAACQKRKTLMMGGGAQELISYCEPPPGTIHGNAIACFGGKVLQVISADQNATQASADGPLEAGARENGRIFARRCDRGNCSGSYWTRIPISFTSAGDSHYSPDATYTSDGVPVVVWVYSQPGDIAGGEIYFSFRGPGGWVTAQPLVTAQPSSAFAHSPAIAADENGGVVVVWCVDTSADFFKDENDFPDTADAYRTSEVYYSWRDSSFAELHSGQLIGQPADGAEPPRLHEYPAVDIDRNNRAFVVWTTSNSLRNRPDDHQRIQAAYVVKGAPEGERLRGPFWISEPEDPRGAQDMPSVSIDPTGDAMISWVETGGYGFRDPHFDRDPGTRELVYASREDNGTTFDIHFRDLAAAQGGHTQITDDPYDQIHPAKDGRYIVYTSQEDGGEWYDLYVFDFQGGDPQPTRLTEQDWHQTQPDILGSTVVYVSVHATEGRTLCARDLTDSPDAVGQVLVTGKGISDPSFGSDIGTIFFSAYPGLRWPDGSRAVQDPSGQDEKGRTTAKNIYRYKNGTIKSLNGALEDQVQPFWAAGGGQGYLVYASQEDSEELGDPVFPDPLTLHFEAQVLGGTAVGGGFSYLFDIDGKTEVDGKLLDDHHVVYTFDRPSQPEPKDIYVTVTDGSGNSAGSNLLQVTVFPEGPPLIVDARADPGRIRPVRDTTCTPPCTLPPCPVADCIPTNPIALPAACVPYLPVSAVITADFYGGVKDANGKYSHADIWIIETVDSGGGPQEVHTKIHTEPSPAGSLTPYTLFIIPEVDLASSNPSPFCEGNCTLVEKTYPGYVELTDDAGNLARANFHIRIGGPPRLQNEMMSEASVRIQRRIKIPWDVNIMRDDGQAMVTLANGIELTALQIGGRLVDEVQPVLRMADANQGDIVFLRQAQTVAGTCSYENPYEVLYTATFDLARNPDSIEAPGTYAPLLGSGEPAQQGRPAELGRFGTSQRVFAQVYSPGNPPENGSLAPSNPAPISAARSYIRHPKVKVGSAGEAVFVWREGLGGRDRIAYNSAILNQATGKYDFISCPTILGQPLQLWWRPAACLNLNQAFVSRVYQEYDPFCVEPEQYEGLVTNRLDDIPRGQLKKWRARIRVNRRIAFINQQLDFVAEILELPADVAIQSYRWAFGDGTVLPGGLRSPTVSHTYTAPGLYSVTLTVLDDHGATGLVGTASIDVTVLDPDAVCPPGAGLAQPDIVMAFAFGALGVSCETYNDPGVDYTYVQQGDPWAMAYNAEVGWGYEILYDDNSPFGDREGYGMFGPFDDSPNDRGIFAGACQEALYNSFVGAKDFTAPCSSDTEGSPDAPCRGGEQGPEGIVFRIDVPNGLYRFVGAFGDAQNSHAHRILAEDGGEGPPADIGPNHVVLVGNFDQAQWDIGEALENVPGAGVYALVGFDDKRPPPGDGEFPSPQFVNVDENGNATSDCPTSPTLEVTQGYVRIHQLQGNSNEGPGGVDPDPVSGIGPGDPNGGDMVILELWRMPEDFGEVRFLRGDSDDTGRINITDAVFSLGCLFLGGRCPGCQDAADANDDGTVNITDAVFTLGCLFIGTACPAPPYPGCGPDPSLDDALDCEDYRSCP